MSRLSSRHLCPRLFATQGFVHAEGLVPAALLGALRRLFVTRTQTVMHQLRRASGKSIGIGSRDGFFEVVQRSPDRFDVPLVSPQVPMEATVLARRDRELLGGDLVWGEFVREVLWSAQELSSGPELCFAGAVVSLPNAPAQQWHIDSPHVAHRFLPPHCLNVVVALEDVPLAAGPTEVFPKSHVLTNHLAHPALSREDLLYQSGREVTPEVLRQVVVEEARKDKEAAPTMETLVLPLAAGDVLIFDDRLLHRGGANRTGVERCIGYFSYRRVDKARPDENASVSVDEDTL